MRSYKSLQVAYRFTAAVCERQGANRPSLSRLPPRSSDRGPRAGRISGHPGTDKGRKSRDYPSGFQEHDYRCLQGHLYRNWLPNSGEELRDYPIFFHYLNLKMDTPKHELLTDVHLPLK
jgi:hypothetical protein